MKPNPFSKTELSKRFFDLDRHWDFKNEKLKSNSTVRPNKNKQSFADYDALGLIW
jgi:hypothetical protein